MSIPKKTKSKKKAEPETPAPTPSLTKKLLALINKHGYKVYPLLFAIFPLLSFYHSNEAEIRSGDFALLPFFIFNLMAVAIIWPLALLVTRNPKKASILSVVALTIFFAFGRIHDHIRDFALHIFGASLGPTKLLVLLSIVILVAAWFGLRRLSAKSIKATNMALSLVGAYLVITSLVAIILPLLTDKQTDKQNSGTQSSKITTAHSKIAAKDLPDIYYILLDGYARQDILKQNFDYDNSAFVSALRKRGFYVADKSYSNYPHTHLSVPSTFNMKYLDDLAEDVGSQSNDRSPLLKIFQYNSVVPIFKSFGYNYITIGSQWSWANTSPYSDINVSSARNADSKIVGIKLDEFALVYLQTTAIKPWITKSIRGTLLARILGAFERTEKVSKIAEPTLSFTHILTPHPPYLFNRNGPIPGLTDKLALNNPGFSNRKGYVDQMVYANKLTLHMVDTILKNSKRPPIIILDSDHGPASSLNDKDWNQTDPSKLNVKGVRERTADLLTLYFPDHDYKLLYPGMTNVNIFPTILDQFFGQKIKQLPDKVYFASNLKHQYEFIDVTKIVDAKN